MKSNSPSTQAIYTAALTVWSILAASAIMLIDQRTFILALALLVMIVIFTVTRFFPFSSLISMLVASAIYLVSYFSIYHFSVNSLITPGIVVIIFIITAGVSALFVQKMNKNVGKISNELQLLNELKQFDPETGLLLWKHARNKIEAELVRCRRYKKNFALVFIEPVFTTEETLGADIRKESNLTIAKLLMESSRIDVDIPFIGNHFGVILPETDAKGAEIFSKRMLANSAKNLLLDLRIAAVSFPKDGVTTEDLITTCENTLQVAIGSQQSIVRADNIKSEPEPNIAVTEPVSPVDVSVEIKADYFDNLVQHEFLLTFSDFYNMADLPIIQENIAEFPEITESNLIEYSDGRLVFKFRSETYLPGKEFSEKFMNNLREKWVNKTKKEG